MSSHAQNPVGNAPEAAPSHERGATVPIWLIVVMFLLLYWGALYFDQNGAWFSPKVYAPLNSVQQVVDLNNTLGGPNPAEAGRAVYAKTCVACHQANGQGAPGQFPPLTGSEWVNEPGPGRIIRLVLQGLQGPITVKGQTYNNVMVPWNALSNEDIADVLTYVRQNKEWGNDAPAVTPEQVQAVREKVKNHPGSFTAAELLQIPPNE